MSLSNPVTFLDMTLRLAQEAAVNGVNVPSSVNGNTGESKRLGDWIADAWREIQGTRKWSFLWEQVSIVILNGTNTLATTLEAPRWDKEQAWLVPASSDNGNRNLDYLEWPLFSSTYQRLGQPGGINAWSVRPDKVFVVNALALGDTTINVQRWKYPQMLVNDTDVPLLPSDLTMLIVYTALKKYAGYDEAGAQRTIAVDEMKTLKEALFERCLPEFTMGGSLLDYYA
jgi:hypothetical protein